MSSANQEEIAKQAYSAYAQVTGWKNYQGYPMPQWGMLPVQIRQAWIAASVEAVRAAKSLNA